MVGGIFVPLINQMKFDFSYLGSGVTEPMTLAYALNVIMFNQGLLVIRVHQNNIGANASMSINCFPAWPADRDYQTFVDTTADVAYDVTSSDTAPAYVKVAASSINGPFWAIQLVGNQASSPTTLEAQLSVGLILRNA